ncbi:MULTISPECIES: SlyX family protein [unclassified Acinetobacter]|uniref:SlyX family protein n=1 Tax=unclassified Acinetobacter TaxID=196816 RepID=UPI00190C145C|nr:MULTISPECIES: SlyX family protein [unclassified Acinetobacter]MBK0062713.1 SlyX family protein [Acinetobacter sp. S55]MBK0065710.1 SlyX family protein [Acinetobacter sp. S54]
MTKPTDYDDHASFSAPIEDLQVRIAFLDDLVEQLNTQLALQSKEIVDLKKQMQLLYQRVEATDLSEGIAPFDPLSNKPPHY